MLLGHVQWRLSGKPLGASFPIPFPFVPLPFSFPFLSALFWAKRQAKLCCSQSIARVLIARCGHWVLRCIDHYLCDAWPVWHQTYGHHPSCTASPSLVWYHIALLGDCHMGMNNFPRVLTWYLIGWELNPQSFDCEFSALTTEPPSHFFEALRSGGLRML